MTVPKMMNTADGGDTGRLPQKSEKNFLIGLRGKKRAADAFAASAARFFAEFVPLRKTGRLRPGKRFG